jgi:hypothetical protein
MRVIKFELFSRTSDMKAPVDRAPQDLSYPLPLYLHFEERKAFDKTGTNGDRYSMHASSIVIGHASCVVRA